MTHWGGPVKYIDTSRATPFIVLENKELLAIISELENKVNEKDILLLFSFLRDREIVDIVFK